VGENYPFVHFLSVFFVPYAVWLVAVELFLVNANDNKVTLSFGQVCTPLFSATPR
jgi:hypothetical protein